MITRENAKMVLEKYLENDSLRKHCLAVGLIMESLAEKFGENKDKWFITGLLHDIDLDVIGDEMDLHGLKGVEILNNYDVDDEIKGAILAHADQKKVVTNLDKWLWASDPLSGLVNASTLMRPDKKISNMPLESLKKKFKSKKFAAGVNREQIKSCENFGLSLDEFLSLAIEAMSKRENELIDIPS